MTRLVYIGMSIAAYDNDLERVKPITTFRELEDMKFRKMENLRIGKGSVRQRSIQIIVIPLK